MKRRTGVPSPQRSPAERERGKSARRESSLQRARVLILSDTHGVVDARIASLAHDADVVVHGGDIGNAEVIATLQAGGARVVAVRGNNDVASKWPRGEENSLATLADVERVELPGGMLVAVHGDHYAPKHRHAKLRAEFPDARAIVYGHSHRLLIDDAATPIVVNPGAAGRARTYGGPSCIVLDAWEKAWRFEPHRFAPVMR
jgi:uncharacterized protein